MGFLKTYFKRSEKFLKMKLIIYVFYLKLLYMLYKMVKRGTGVRRQLGLHSWIGELSGFEFL